MTFYRREATTTEFRKVAREVLNITWNGWTNPSIDDEHRRIRFPTPYDVNGKIVTSEDCANLVERRLRRLGFTNDVDATPGYISCRCAFKAR